MEVFLSHQHGDKPVVEPIAIALKDKLGEANVFYDSWSIKPGEGIIEKMNKGMTAPDFVFFFVSENSLASGMVKLEWHNALYKGVCIFCKHKAKRNPAGITSEAKGQGLDAGSGAGLWATTCRIRSSQRRSSSSHSSSRAACLNRSLWL